MRTLKIVRNRLLMAIPVLLGITIVAFLLTALVPGDVAEALLGPKATKAGLAALRAKEGLNESIIAQYFLFLKHAVTGDLGYSLVLRQSVGEAIMQALPVTLFLVVYSLVVAIVLAVPLATLAALRSGGLVDHVVRIVVVTGFGLPTYWVGVLLVTYVALDTGVLPVSGYGSGFLGHLESLFLPALTLALTFLAVLVRALRASLIEVLESDYVAEAEMKGIGRLRLLVRHVLRAGIPPAVTLIGLSASFLVGGTVIVENIYALPGLGMLLVNSMLARDLQVVRGIALVIAVLVVAINLVIDVTYARLDPRVTAIG